LFFLFGFCFLVFLFCLSFCGVALVVCREAWAGTVGGGSDFVASLGLGVCTPFLACTFDKPIRCAVRARVLYLGARNCAGAVDREQLQMQGAG
ncbi:MAG: hypothetical protein OXL39_10425, partial [Caldilineaceae bacterium]|nr:hypothetical protein [Caldilineaceae bacterium]